MFMMLARRGAMPRFGFDLACAVSAERTLDSVFVVSANNELIGSFLSLDVDVFAQDLFSTNLGALTRSWRIPQLRRSLSEFIRRRRIELVVNLMPHVWSPFLAGALRQAGARYATVVHDAAAHPGDHTAIVKRILELDLRHADHVVTLSRAVSDQLLEQGKVNSAQLHTLFHPEFRFERTDTPRPPEKGDPWRLLFLGRMMRYKGLPLLLDAVELLRNRGWQVQLSVWGEGDIAGERERLERLGAQVHNHWLSEEEIAQALSAAHVLVLAHTEASQSGLIAAAMGYGLPVVTTPVGGLSEQVDDRQTGIISAGVDSLSLANAVETLLSDPDLYRHVGSEIKNRKEKRSMRSFALACAEIARNVPGQGG